MQWPPDEHTPENNNRQLQSNAIETVPANLLKVEHLTEL